MLTIQEFCDKHKACTAGRRWALDNCTTMQEAWDKCPKVGWLVWIATRPNVLDDKSLRLFAVWCCRQIQHLMKDPRAIAALDAAEQFANGLITANQLADARKSAYAAAAAATYAAAAASAAAADAAYAYAYATNEEAKIKQMNYLRQNCKPNFE